MFDVVIVGAGPGGSAAAKRCAERGLSTLILEKKELPREKICSGMLLGPLAKTLVAEEFGQLPPEVVLAELRGLVLWMPGVGRREIDSPTPITWRKDLDSWLVRRALDTGAEVWDRAWVRGVEAVGGRYTIRFRRAGVERDIEARFVIGAEGSYSTVRNSVFPELRVAYTPAFRECYQGTLKLKRDYAYIVFAGGRYRPNLWINPKGDCFTVEGGLRELRAEKIEVLTASGWDGRAPLWKDGCVSRALLFEHWAAGTFVPAKGNVLLVGDAAGLKIPVSGEGIGTALRSGLLAAEAVVAAIVNGHEAAESYVDALRPLLADLGSCYAQLDEIKTHTGLGLLDELAEAFAESLEVF